MSRIDVKVDVTSIQHVINSTCSVRFFLGAVDLVDKKLPNEVQVSTERTTDCTYLRIFVSQQNNRTEAVISNNTHKNYSNTRRTTITQT